MCVMLFEKYSFASSASFVVRLLISFVSLASFAGKLFALHCSREEPAMPALTPIRRVVTGNDSRGKSKVVWDGPAPNAHMQSMALGRGHTDLWVWNETPMPLAGKNDDGNLDYVFTGPENGGHLR